MLPIILRLILQFWPYFQVVSINVTYRRAKQLKAHSISNGIFSSYLKDGTYGIYVIPSYEYPGLVKVLKLEHLRDHYICYIAIRDHSLIFGWGSSGKQW